MPAKMATSDRLKIKIFLKKGCGVIISVHGVTSKILSRDSNNNVMMRRGQSLVTLAFL